MKIFISSHINKKFYLFVFCFVFSVQGLSQPYFYKGKNYGSDAMYNPVYLILNGSFDIIQLDSWSRKITTYPYYAGASNVLRNLANPFTPVSHYGWGNFLRNEVFPVDITKKGAQWWPNYQLHLIGGGMTYTALKEWYAAHNFQEASLLSISTVTVYHLLNEFVENENLKGDNVDPIADIYIFDLGGILLFSSESVNKFFSEELHLADWSLQPSFSIHDFSLQNNGQYFSIKWKLPFSEEWHLFYYFGMNGLTGFSYKMKDETAISFGAGLRAKNRFVVNSATHQESLNLVWNTGMFYDKENSLLASLFVSGLTDYVIDVNIYPGVVRIGNFSPGLWGVVRKNGHLLLGITTVWLPGISL